MRRDGRRRQWCSEKLGNPKELRVNKNERPWTQCTTCMVESSSGTRRHKKEAGITRSQAKRKVSCPRNRTSGEILAPAQARYVEKEKLLQLKCPGPPKGKFNKRAPGNSSAGLVLERK